MSTHRVMTLLRDPPTQGKYTALNAQLLWCYSLSDAERPKKLLYLSGLGDGTACELIESMLSLLGTDDSRFLFPQTVAGVSWPRQLPAAGLERLPLTYRRSGSHYPGYQELQHSGDSSRITDGISHATTDSPGGLQLIDGGWDCSTRALRNH
ncbi:unnamed protein product [Oreochromis niloticus]|nr:unnamed protein product [Mustela putorius furo]